MGILLSINGFVTLSNVRMYYEITGAGDPLLLIHGLDSDSRMWDQQFNTFRQFFKTIRFDCRGFGKTTMPPGEFQLLDDIHDLLNGLGIESAHIVGYSYGGTIAPSFAIKYPDMVKSLILVSPGMVGYKWSPKLQDYFKKFQETYTSKHYDDMFRLLFWKSVYGPYRKEEGLGEICDLVKEMFQNALSITPRDGKPLPTGDTRNHLTEITCPTLILSGELDFEDYHIIADIYNERIPRCQKRIFPNSAHFINLEQPRLFNKEIIDFLQSLKEV